MTTHHDLAELFDGALSAARTHQAGRACELMREVLERTSSLPPDAVVEGSEELPAGFYFNSAQAFLHIHTVSDLAVLEDQITIGMGRGSP